MSDPLTQIIQLLRPSALDTKIVHASGDWRVQRTEVGQVFYCMIMTGGAHLNVKGRDPVPLSANDFVLVPAAATYVMSSLSAQPGTALQITRPVEREGVVFIGSGSADTSTKMLIGYCRFGSPDADILVSLLPEIIVVRDAERISTLSQLVTDEAKSDRAGRDVVLEHLMQVMMIDALRSCPKSKASPGLISGLADEQLSSVLRALHARPQHAWSLVELSRFAGLSRSAFCSRFSAKVGKTPMEYLQSIRMTIAKNELRTGGKTIAEIAHEIGYGSASAFSIAFSKQTGISPGRYARQTESGKEVHVT